MRHFWLFCLICFLLVSGPGVHASSFDLAGPKVDLRVKRGDQTLPIASVPNLLGGDRLWVHPDLPPTQSERFVLVVAFLRGVTNPPPPEWFVRVETWTSSVRAEGVYVTVPNEAQQAVLFLVPETGGDFNTLKKAVRSEPGSFVRAVQDLQAASWDRMRVEAYLSQVKVTSQYDQKTLKERAELSSRSLGIKINHDCFDKPAEQQAACLAQNPDSLVLDDSDAQSRVAQLTSGSTGDLMNAISSTSMAGSGAYSAYVGAVVDTAKILGSLHTAHFRYIPALALPAVDTLNLRLATPPSFRNPKSVVVIALPPMGAVRLPMLHPVNPADRLCVEKPGLVLPAEGAPLFYATDMPHDLTLHIETPGKNDSVDLPLNVEMARGGLVLSKMPATLPQGELTGEVRGKWGFDDWKGPRFHLRAASNGSWNVTSADQSALVVGRNDLLHLEGQDALCLDRIEAHDKTGSEIHVTWKSPKPETLELNVPLKAAAPGPISFSIYQFGRTKPQALSVMAFDDAAALDSISLNAGDTEVRLKGKRLDEVANASIEGTVLKPGELSRVGDTDQLTMISESPFAKLAPGKHYAARVELRDGRVLKTQVTVEPPRPQALLLSKGVQQRSSQSVQMGSVEDLPLDGRLVFFLKSVVPSKFLRNQKIELGAADESFQTTLSLSDGSLILQDTHTVMGTLEPLSRFGASAFGPIHARVVSANGTPGTWLPLGTLVRLPEFKELRCPRAATKACTLTGTNLFLATAFSATQNFSETVDVPTGFTGTQISVPHPSNGALYLKLRDDPATVQTLTMPIVLSTAPETLPAPPAAAAPSATPESSSVAPKPAASAAQPAAPATTVAPKTAAPEAKASTDAAETPKNAADTPAAQPAPASEKK